ncbi:zinc finger Fpg domain protein, partial [gut metagenome]
QIEIIEGEGGIKGELEEMGVVVVHAEGEKCARCWKYDSTVGSHSEHPDLCARCAAILEE